MGKQSEETFYYKVEKLEDLVINQQKALKLADELLDMKSRLIELCEEETQIYKRENKRLIRSLIICGVVLILNVIVHLISLAH